MDFIPGNELEKSLLKVQNGEISGEQFLKELLDMELFMPVLEKHEIAGFSQSKNATPLTIEDENGQQVVVLFSSPERAKEFPGYDGGLLTEFKWIIEKIGGSIGIILNPGMDVGFELEAEMLDQLTQN